MNPSTHSPTPSPRSHTDRLAIWAVDVSGWTESLENNTDFDSLPDTALEPSSPSPAHKGKGTKVDRIIEDLFGDNGIDPISDDMRRASTKIRKYFRQVDRVRSLAGQILPRIMYMQEYGPQCSWSNMKFDATPEKRPFLAEPELPGSTDYNVTHDEDWIAIAYHRPILPRDSLGNVVSATTSIKDVFSNRSASSSLDSLTSCGSRANISDAGSISTAATSIHEQDPLRVGIDVMAVALPQFDPSVAGFVNMMELAMTPAEKEWVYAANPSARDGGEDDYDFFAPKKPGSTRKQPKRPEQLKPEELEMLMRLYDLWTYKEAFTKNIGRGLGFDFSTIEVALWRCGKIPVPDLETVTSPKVPPTPGTAAAIVVEDSIERIIRAAKEHGSRISAGPSSSPASSSSSSTVTKPILTTAGKPEGRYSFTEIHLPSSRKEARKEAKAIADAAKDARARAAANREPLITALTPASLASASQASPPRARSQLVVCEGPFPEGTFSAWEDNFNPSSTGNIEDDNNDDQQHADIVQVAPALEYEDAIKSGLLKVWTMEELVAEARRLRRASSPAS